MHDDFAPPPSSASVDDMTRNLSGACVTRARRDSRQSRRRPTRVFRDLVDSNDNLDDDDSHARAY